MRRIGFLCLALVLMLALMLPTAVYAKGDEVTAKRYAIVIGISDYPGEGSIFEGGMDLFYADDDAVLMKHVLEDPYNFDNVVLLTDQAATRGRILSEIAKLKKRVGEDDKVVFYFSGHCFPWVPSVGMSVVDPVGIATWRGQGNDAAGFALIRDFELKRAFEGFGTDRIVFIFDCCLAGGMTELAGDGRIVCMAAGAGQQAAEVGPEYAFMFPSPIPSEMLGLYYAENGLFTYFFAELGLQYGLADIYPPGDGDGYVTVEEAFYFAYFNLVQMSSEWDLLDQTPVMSIDGVLYP